MKYKAKLAIWLVASVAVLIAVVTLCVVLMGRYDTRPKGVVELDANAKAEFVVNKNAQVIAFNCINRDAELIVGNIEIFGVSIVDVARAFVDGALKIGALKVNCTAEDALSTNAVKVLVTLSDANKAQELTDSVCAAVNRAFDDKGVFGVGQAMDVSQVQTEAEAAGLSVNKYILVSLCGSLDYVYDKDAIKSKSEQEILDIIYSRLHQYERVSESKRAELVNELRYVDEVIAYRAAMVHVDSCKAQLETASESEIEILKNELKQAEKAAYEKKAAMDKAVKAVIAEAEKKSKPILDAVKTDYSARISAYDSVYSEHRDSFRENKEEILANITAWREGLS